MSVQKTLNAMLRQIADELIAAIRNQAIVAYHLVTGAGSAPTIAAAAGAGTSPPTPTITGNDTRGVLAWGTGTTAAAGAQAAVTFAVPFAAAPTVVITPINSATAAKVPFAAAATTTGFSVSLQVAPADSQAATVYSVAYHVIG